MIGGREDGIFQGFSEIQRRFFYNIVTEKYYIMTVSYAIMQETILQKKRVEACMHQSIHEYYYSVLPEQLHFAYVPERSAGEYREYRMLSGYGEGSFKMTGFHQQFVIMTADFTPIDTFEKVSEIARPYVEISRFETDSSSWRVGQRKLKPVEQGICCYVNTSRTVYSYCEAGEPARFTKILLTQDYFDSFIRERYGGSYSSSVSSLQYLTENPNSPQLNFVFQQIRDCTAVGTALQIYLESKVLEMLSLVTHHYNQADQYQRLPVKLDYKDRQALAKTIVHMKQDLAAYPTVSELARIADMSDSRYQLAFKHRYGTTVYEYLKNLRMNQALLLLRNSDYDVQAVAASVGYGNAGHFSGLFRKLYGVSPKKYRSMHGIK